MRSGTESLELPFVSVIVPTYNRQRLLEALLDSLETLEYPRERFEVIIVVDPSGDLTAEMLESRVKTAPYQLVYDQNRTGQSSPATTRNVGLRRARGEIVAFTDSDCVVTKDWLRAGVKALQQTSGIVCGWTIPHAEQRRTAIHKSIPGQSNTRYFETCNIFYRREWLEAVNGFHPDFEGRFSKSWGEDIDLAYRVKALGYPTTFQPDAVVMHQIIPERFLNWLFAPKRLYIWPFLVQRHPAMRKDLMYHGVFLNRMTAYFDLCLLSFVSGLLVSPYFFVGAFPFLLLKFREGGQHLNPLLRAARIVGGSVRAFVTFVVLTAASVRFRTVVL